MNNNDAVNEDYSEQSQDKKEGDSQLYYNHFKDFLGYLKYFYILCQVR